MKNRTPTKKASPKATARKNVITFCQILDDLPVNFGFTLSNAKDYEGYWKKISSEIVTVWQNGSRVLLNSAFFPVRRQVIEAIEREGWQVKKLCFADQKPKKAPVLTKEKIKELYYEQKKSLQDIAKEYGCTKQWLYLLMKKYGLKRRTHSEATIEANNQGKGPWKKER